MNETAEQVYNQLKNAPDDIVHEVYDFTEYLIKKNNIELVESKALSSFDSFAGVLKNSPSFEGDPVLVQQRMRNEWD